MVIGLGHAHLVGRQPPPASDFVRGIVKPARLYSWQSKPLGEDRLLLRVEDRHHLVVLDGQLRLRERGHLILRQTCDVSVTRLMLRLGSWLLLFPSPLWLLGRCCFCFCCCCCSCGCCCWHSLRWILIRLLWWWIVGLIHGIRVIWRWLIWIVGRLLLDNNDGRL